MANPDLLNVEERRKIIAAIKSPENRSRKLDEQRKFDIYKKKQASYVLQRLTDEFDAKTVQNMRKVLSINPCKRIVDEQASLYVNEPERHFTGGDEGPIDDKTQGQIDELYETSKVNQRMRLANRYYKLNGQSCLYSVPKNGEIYLRALNVKDYDVIPDADNPEDAFAYILNVMDVDLYKTAPQEGQASRSQQGYTENDKINSEIADQSDRKALLERYVFWTADLHFTCNGQGEITDAPYQDEKGNKSPVNPIGMLPFVDIAHEKDFTFFVRMGSDIAEFVIDFLSQLSDLANTCRFQNYSQAIVYSTEEPRNIKVGPNSVIWLKIDPNAQNGTPKFAFESPKPDIAGTMEFLNFQLKMFLSSVGLNPGTVSGKNEMEKFTSGIDHLLANLDKFKASLEDMDLFRQVECETWDILVAWQNALYDVTGDGALNDDLKQVKLDPTLEPDIVFSQPQAVQTEGEVEDYCIKGVESGLMTKLEAIKRIYGVGDDRAKEILAELKAEEMQAIKDAQSAMSTIGGGTGAPGAGKTGEVGPDGVPIDGAPAAKGAPVNPDGTLADPGAGGMAGNNKPGVQVVKLPKPLTGSKTK